MTDVILIMLLNGAMATLHGTSTLLTFRGTSDTSAAVAVGDDHVVVGDDENNVLRCYDVHGGMPVAQWDLSAFLKAGGDHPEVDIEAATRVGDRIYWISSHGRNKDGKLRPNRYRVFATHVSGQGARVTLTPEGKVCRNLAQQLAQAPTLASLHLASCMQLDQKKVPSLAPKKKGLNIEGLAASADGRTLYLGFRNPRPQKRALVVPWENPRAVIDQGEAAVFGPPLLWDLDGWGIRGMEYVPAQKTFYVIAGSHKGKPGGRLYRWSGVRTEAPQPVSAWSLPAPDFTPETVVVFPTRPDILIFSDDGSRLIKVRDTGECQAGTFEPGGWCKNKALLDPKRKSFRGLWMDPR